MDKNVVGKKIRIPLTPKSGGIYPHPPGLVRQWDKPFGRGVLVVSCVMYTIQNVYKYATPASVMSNYRCTKLMYFI